MNKLSFVLSLCLAIALGYTSACKDTIRSTTPLGGGAENDDSIALEGHPALQSPPEQISAFRLDQPEFLVTQVTTGLQTFIESETVVLTYIKPQASDYVEILRCMSDVKLISNSGAISMTDFDLTGLSENDRSQFFAANDLFSLGASQGCSLASDGYAGDDHFQDTYAPSGNFRYFVRACVHPKRLKDKEFLSSRNCSRRFGVSKLVTFTNKRSLAEIKHLKKVQEYSSRIDEEATNISYLAIAANQALNSCSLTEQQRLIAVKVRNAWVTIGASILDIGVELKTANLAEHIKPGQSRASALLAHYTSPTDNWLDMAQLVNSTQGALFAGPLTLITSSAADMPRTCTSYLRISQETNLAQYNLQLYVYRLSYHRLMVDLAIGKQQASDGIDVNFNPESGQLDF